MSVLASPTATSPRISSELVQVAPLTTPAPAPTPIISRSCHTCNSKKIRCNRTQPCSSCVRSGKTCTYPPARRVRRTKKTILADMASRLSSLERSVASGREEVEPSVSDASSTSALAKGFRSPELETVDASAAPIVKPVLDEILLSKLPKEVGHQVVSLAP